MNNKDKKIIKEDIETEKLPFDSEQQSDDKDINPIPLYSPEELPDLIEPENDWGRE